MLSVKIIGLLAILGVVSAELSIAPYHAETSLVNFMIESRALTAENPQRSMECFGLYTPILNQLTTDYQKEYADCVESASKQRNSVDEGTAPERKKLESFATSACQAVQSCSENKESTPYFECFIKQGNENTKTMYAISANASEILLNVQEQYRLITNSQFKCTNASERAYVDKTSSTFEELHNCLLGLETKPITEAPATKPTEAPEPEKPTDEQNPEEPKPEEPETPTDEQKPEEPKPEEPETPTDEQKPEEPKPEEPETPTDEQKPEEPKPEEPESPTDEQKPVEPETKPEEPETPTDEQKPVEPETKPEEPETPTDEQKPEEPETQPEEPENPTEIESFDSSDDSSDSSSGSDSSNDSERRVITEEGFLKSIFNRY